MKSREESSDEEGLPDGPVMMADRCQDPSPSGAEGRTARKLRLRWRSLASRVLSSSKKCWKYRLALHAEGGGSSLQRKR